MLTVCEHRIGACLAATVCFLALAHIAHAGGDPADSPLYARTLSMAFANFETAGTHGRNRDARSGDATSGTLARDGKGIHKTSDLSANHSARQMSPSRNAMGLRLGQTHDPGIVKERPAEATSGPLENWIPTHDPSPTGCMTTVCGPVSLCHPISTDCPAQMTQCPPEMTQCPSLTTQCPSVATQCPPARTECPTQDTVCPAQPTLCPPVVRFTAASSSIGEWGPRARIPVRISCATPRGMSVWFEITTGTARSGEDYIAPPSRLDVRPNATLTTISLPIIDDVRDEYDETIVFLLLNPTTGTVGAPSTHTLTILDNDPLPILEFENEAQRVPESIGTAYVPVRLSARSGRTVTVYWCTADATAVDGRDYVGHLASWFTLPPGQTSATLGVRILPDQQIEGDEWFELYLRDPTNASRGNMGHCTLTIEDATAVRRWPLYR